MSKKVEMAFKTISSRGNLFLIGFLYLLFFLRAYFSLDPDFGWHLKMGEFILSHGIPSHDPFSYTMSSFPFVDHEWGLNVLIYTLYKSIGWLGLAIIFSIIPLLAISIVFRFRSREFLALPILLCGFSLLFFSGIRTQEITWLMYSVLIVVLFNEKFYKKLRIFFPLFFLLWANLHGGFALGIFTYFLFLVLKVWKEKKIEIWDFAIFTLSVVATLANPYGAGLWGEIYMQMSDSSLRWTVGEWTPAVVSFYPSLWFFFALSGILFLKYHRTLGIFEKSLYLGLLLAGLSSIRHMTLWLIAAAPILSLNISALAGEARRYREGKTRFIKSYGFIVLLGAVFGLMPVLSNPSGSLGKESFYPIDAVSYLKKNPTSGNVFSEYGWGGYLIWKYPEKKVFVDGRMPSWRWHGDKKNESNYAFRDYNNLLEGKISLNEVTAKYNIDTFLLPVKAKADKSLYNTLSERLESLLIKKKNGDNIYTQLKKNGWKTIYNDNISVIYRKL